MTLTSERPPAGVEDVAVAELPSEADASIAPSLVPWYDPDRFNGWLWTLAVVLVAAVTRFWALGFPASKMFDEVYYATEAQEMLRYGYEDNPGYMFIVHPPLGKWLIAGPSAIFGNNAIGWRVAPAIAGTLAVLLLARTARRMFHSNLLGAVAGLLLTLDGMSLVLSRSALLDIFLQLFIVAGFAAMVADRDQVRARLYWLVSDGVDLSSDVPRLGPRPWRLTAGVMFGLAGAVKWTTLSFWVAFAILSLVWDRNALKAAGARRAWVVSIRRSWLGALFSYLVAPVAVYLFCNIGWFAGNNSVNRHWADYNSPSATLHVLGLHIPFWWGWVPAPIRSLGSYTLGAYRFHEGLDSGHAYQSNPWGWLVDGRGVLFYYDGNATGCGSGQCVKTVLLLGTPILWWTFVPVLLFLLWYWATTRDWRAAVPWVAMAAGWLVWFQDLKRTMFMFYMAPLVPFLILGITLALGVLLGPADRAGVPRTVRRRRLGILGVSAYLGAVVADFAWMWPIFTGGLLSFHAWQAHMWFPTWV